MDNINVEGVPIEASPVVPAPTPVIVVVEKGNGEGIVMQELPKSDLNNQQQSAEVPSSFTPSPPMVDSSLIYDSRTLWQTIAFTWLNDVFTLGAKQTLEQGDLIDLPRSVLDYNYKREYSSNNTDKRQSSAHGVGEYEERVGKAWEKEVAIINAYNASLDPKDPSLQTKLKAARLADAIWREFGKDMVRDGLFRLVSDACNLLSPLILNFLVLYVQECHVAILGGVQSTEPSLGTGVGLSFTLLGMAVVSSIFNNQQIQRTTIFALNLRYALISHVYKKSTRLSYRARQVFDSSKVVSIVSTDCARIEMYLINWCWVWAAPIQIVVIIVLLLIVMGWTALPGIAVLAALYPCQNYIMTKLRGVRRAVAPITDTRVRKMQEILLGIRLVKFFGWEEAYMGFLAVVRELELAQVLKRGFIQAQVMLIAFSFPVWAGVVAVSIYSATVSSVSGANAAVLFAALAWFSQIRQPMFWWPQTLTYKADADVGFDRISLLLAAEELTNHVEDGSILYPESAILIKDGSFRWDTVVKTSPATAKVGDDTANNQQKQSIPTKLPELDETVPPQLQGLNINIPKGKLVAIVGAVGAGKSTLLNSIIGETSIVTGHIYLNGSLGLASQQPWIQNANIKENVLFGQPYDEVRYLEAIRASALERDLEILPDGDKTEIGERGINLSGGQKQRVSLARLVYYSPDVALLDDPLSAVDVHVGQYLFKHLLRGGPLSKKTRVLVTHQLGFLPLVDYIYVLNDGKVQEEGDYETLVRKGGDFALYLGTQDISSVSQEELHQEETAQDAHSRILKMLEVKGENKARVLMQEEERATGVVDPKIWFSYMRASGFFLFSAIFFGFLFQVFKVFTDYWIVFWSSDDFPTFSRNLYIGCYCALAFCQSVSVYTMAANFAMASVTGARKLHAKALDRVLRAPLSWFDATPTGRIMNRFAKDQDGVDNAILDSLRRFIINFMNAISIFVVIMVGTPLFGIPLIAIVAFYYYTQNRYRKSSREMKRIESVSRSPLFAQIGESLGGLATIKSYGETHRFIALNEQLVRRNQKPYFNLMSATQWLSVRLEAASALVVFFAAIFGVLSRNNISYSAQTLGLSMIYALQITQVVNFCVKLFIESEIAMNQVERIEYFGSQVEQEAPLHIPSKQPPADWPQQGNISITGMDAKYAPTLPLVLKNITLNIKGGEKIGIVGRTGSGKSTIIQTLFRTIEPSAGSIVIDGINVMEIGLYDLRSAIKIIPQDPILFSGSVRMNMDPFNQYTDKSIWDALERASMKEKVMSMGAGLDSILQVLGENLSVGERQLTCLARALVSTPKILVMDEATANVDFETDERIQKCLRKELHQCTLITIAHRLNTILDYDKIVVLQDGEVVEFETPAKLLQIPNGIFAAMVSAK